MRRLMILPLAAALALTACASDDATEPPAEEQAEDGGDAAGGALTFIGTDELAWEESAASTATGSVEITIECGENVAHTVAIEGVDGGEAVAECSPGEPGTATVELEAGDYTFFCTVPGHRDAGMEGTLTARAG